MNTGICKDLILSSGVGAMLPAAGFGPIAEKKAAHCIYGLPIVDSCVACTLRNQTSFCMLSQRATEEFNNLKHVSMYPRGALIFLEGQDARGVYVLCQGRGKLTTTNADGKTIILKIAEPGTMLGLNACISGKTYDSTLETSQPAQLAFVSRPDFLSFLKRNPEASLQATQQLARDCQAAYQLVRSIGLSRLATQRLARLLLEWSSTSGAVNEKIRFKSGWTQQELAQLIGTTRETVSRTMSALKKKGIVRVSGSTIFVINKAALQELIAD